MFGSPEEKEFLLSNLNSHHKVLEYGSGSSTNEIAGIVGEIISIEHNVSWFEKVKLKLPKNASIFYKPPSPPLKKWDEGTFEQFKEYIEYPIRFAPFDIVFIDGRARVGCASVCNKLGDENTVVFIHDFDRVAYHKALDYLELIDQVGTMAKFKIKCLT